VSGGNVIPQLQVCRAIAITSCHCSSTAGSRLTQEASPHTHLALPTSSAPCLPLKWLTSVADSNATTTQNVQDFIAADMLANQLVFITNGGPTVPTWALILQPGYVLLNGYPDARVLTDSPIHYYTLKSSLSKTCLDAGMPGLHYKAVDVSTYASSLHKRHENCLAVNVATWQCVADM